MQKLELRLICINSLGNCDKVCKGNPECQNYQPLYKTQAPYTKGRIAYQLQRRAS